MNKLLFATTNETKSKRFSKQLLKYDIEVVTLNDMGIKLDVEETGNDCLENALIKARSYYKEVNMPIIAVDDNLYFDNIDDNLQPGVYVRRVGGRELSDEEMIEYYSKLASDYGTNGKINARWVYGMALINNNQEYTYKWSKEDFYLVNKKANKIDNGYPLNSITINKKLNKYFVDMTDEDKLLIEDNEDDVIDFIVSNLK